MPGFIPYFSSRPQMPECGKVRVSALAMVAGVICVVGGAVNLDSSHSDAQAAIILGSSMILVGLAGAMLTCLCKKGETDVERQTLVGRNRPIN